MLTIRFSRIGKKRKPFYRIIISEKQRDTQGMYLELLGQYDPRTKEAVLKTDRIAYWLKQGAATSNSVFNLFVQHGIITSDRKRRSVFLSKKRKEKIEKKRSDARRDKAKNEAGAEAVALGTPDNASSEVSSPGENVNPRDRQTAGDGRTAEQVDETGEATEKESPAEQTKQNDG